MMIENLDISVRSVVDGLLETMDELGVPLGGNTQALARLDADSADKYIDELEDKIEDLEYSEDDYYIIDKYDSEDDYYIIDKYDIDIIVTKAMRKMFFAKEGGYIAPEQGDYDQWVDDAIYELKEVLEKNDEKA